MVEHVHFPKHAHKIRTRITLVKVSVENTDVGLTDCSARIQLAVNIGVAGDITV